jgi:nucleoid-associated protein YgaU
MARILLGLVQAKNKKTCQTDTATPQSAETKTENVDMEHGSYQYHHTSDLYIQVTSADRLDILASKLYGDQSLWYIIAAANGLGKGSLVVPPNTVLRIPSTEQTISFINSINTRR